MVSANTWLPLYFFFLSQVEDCWLWPVCSMMRKRQTCTGHDFPKRSNPSLKKSSKKYKIFEKIVNKSNQIEIFLSNSKWHAQRNDTVIGRLGHVTCVESEQTVWGPDGKSNKIFSKVVTFQGRKRRFVTAVSPVCEWTWRFPVRRLIGPIDRQILFEFHFRIIRFCNNYQQFLLKFNFWKLFLEILNLKKIGWNE